MIYTVTFNPAVDYVVTADTFRTGKTNRTKTESIVFGGKGVNVSLLLHALHTKSIALGFIAGFTRINLKLHAEEETELNGSGPEISENELKNFFEKLGALTPQDTLVLSGSVPKSLPKDIYAQIAKLAQIKGVRLIVDAAGDLLLSTLEFQPFLVKPNREELSEMFRAPADTEEQVTALAEELKKRGAKNVLVSMAGDGALLYTETGEVYFAPAAKGTLINSTGAGDSMVGGFLAEFTRSGSFEKALAMGTAAGGATAFSVGIAGFQKIMAVHESVKAGVQRVR